MATQPTIPHFPRGERIPMSYEDFLRLVDEDAHAEWVDGEAIIFMPPSDRHQVLVFWLARVIASYAEFFDLGEVRIAPLEMRARPGGSAREPDILFVSREHRDRLTPQRLVGPADLIVEVISPESVRRDQVEKRREYAAAGVTEYWLVDPRPSVTPLVIYRSGEAGDYLPVAPDAAGRYVSGVLPGFWLDPSWLRLEPLPKPLAIMRRIAPEALRAALDQSDAE
ncbi:MAG TPA: Uma2 family endonuclease [Thermomicrobiales bacterium]